MSFFVYEASTANNGVSISTVLVWGEGRGRGEPPRPLRWTKRRQNFFQKHYGGRVAACNGNRGFTCRLVFWKDYYAKKNLSSISVGAHSLRLPVSIALRVASTVHLVADTHNCHQPLF